MPQRRHTSLSLLVAWLLFTPYCSAFWLWKRADSGPEIDTQLQWRRKGLKRCRPRTLQQDSGANGGGASTSLSQSRSSLAGSTSRASPTTSVSSGFASSNTSGPTITETLQQTAQTTSAAADWPKETGWCPKIWDPQSGPSFRDISQNYQADDCGLLSASASMALTKPEAVKAALPQPECGSTPENGTIAKVTLYDWDLNKHEYSIPIANASGSFTIDGLSRDETGWSWTEGSWVWVGCKACLRDPCSLGPSLPSDGPVAVVEAAYEKMTGDRTAYIDQALTAFTGKKAKTVQILGPDWKDSLLEYSNDHPMVTQTSTTEETTNGLFGGHAYSIFAANDTHAIIRNPWGATPTADDSVPPSSQDLSDDPEWGPSVFAIPISSEDGTGTIVDQSGGLTQISWLE